MTILQVLVDILEMHMNVKLAITVMQEDGASPFKLCDFCIFG